MFLLMEESYFLQLIHAIGEEFKKEIQVGDIGEEISKAISPKTLFSLDFGSFKIPFSDTIVATWVVMIVIALLGYWLGRNFKQIPKRKQVISEGLANIFCKLCEDQHMSSKQVEIVAPFVGSMAIFICLSNITSVFKMTPPAKDPIFPVALALFTVGYVIFTGIRFVGIKGFWASLKYPNAALVPFKILDYIIKPISLSLRLFGNVFGAFILMEFIYIIIPIIVPGVLGLWFDLADGLLQGVVFSYLTIIYIGEIIEGAEQSSGHKKVIKE